MNGCHAIQCLAEDEDGNYGTESDEQDFERESNYFLTGVGDGNPDGGELEELSPERHRAWEILTLNWLLDIMRFRFRH